jgi:hypothetical protein
MYTKSIDFVSQNPSFTRVAVKRLPIFVWAFTGAQLVLWRRDPRSASGFATLT